MIVGWGRLSNMEFLPSTICDLICWGEVSHQQLKPIHATIPDHLIIKPNFVLKTAKKLTKEIAIIVE